MRLRDAPFETVTRGREEDEEDDARPALSKTCPVELLRKPSPQPSLQNARRAYSSVSETLLALIQLPDFYQPGKSRRLMNSNSNTQLFAPHLSI
jgi:hypothetical protein